MGRNRHLSVPGPSDADNGKPDLCTGSPPLHYLGSGVGKKKKKKKKKKNGKNCSGDIDHLVLFVVQIVIQKAF